MTCNFAELWVYDTERDALCREPQLVLAFADLPKNLPAIQFLRGQGEAPESHHALAVLMTRLMFLMFCEDSGLDTPDAERGGRRARQERFARMPYINGGLFREAIEIPMLDESFRTTLLVEGCQDFDWSGVSPTVFGSIFEGALSHDHRRANGQHFTSPANIHKVIDPL